MLADEHSVPQSCFNLFFLSFHSQQVTRVFKQAYTLQKTLPENGVVPALMASVNVMKDRLPIVTDLRNPALQPRHWDRINTIVGQVIIVERGLW